MANILVWGKGRDILAGELPAGITTEEVDGLGGLQAALEGKGSTLVLADPAHLDSEKPALEAWVRSGGNRRPGQCSGPKISLSGGRNSSTLPACDR